jgi:hypothetical protein
MSTMWMGDGSLPYRLVSHMGRVKPVTLSIMAAFTYRGGAIFQMHRCGRLPVLRAECDLRRILSCVRSLRTHATQDNATCLCLVLPTVHQANKKLDKLNKLSVPSPPRGLINDTKMH